ncbi:MAG: DUF3502 domain-containing protein [Lachnospiraceae bacterium]|nr:DUF3502 domain-containing protein [Lachnospiraceae bacterium]
MRKLNKVVALALAAVMGLSLVACGETAPAASTDNTPVASTEAPAASTDNGGDVAASGDVVTINVYRNTFNLGAVDSARTAEIQDAINAYIADKINVQIALTDVVSGEYTDKANLALNNNEINLLWTASWESTIGTKDLYAANAAYDITDLLPGTALYDSMDAGQWEASKYGGRNYFIPVYKDNVEGYDFMFREDLVNQHGWDITTVKTLADLKPMLEDAKNDGLKYPLLLQKTAMFYRWYIDSYDFFTGDATSNWVAVDRKTNEVVDSILTPEYLEFCTLMAEYAEAGYISEDEVNKVTTDTTTQSQDWAISWWTDLPNNGEANGRYGQNVVMQPAGNRYLHTDSMLGSCYCVTANSTEEQAKAAIDFMGLLYTDSKLADMYTYGIEGKDFNYDADGYVEKVTDASYNHSMWESASATVVTCESSSVYTPQMYIDFNSSALISCANGFHFDKTPVEAAYTACQAIFDEYGFPLETGGVAASDVAATIEAYQAALDAAGYQDVLAEFQSQYDAWK